MSNFNILLDILCILYTLPFRPLLIIAVENQ